MASTVDDVAASVHDVLGRFGADGIERVELKVADLRGHWHAIGLVAHQFGEESFRRGISIDAAAVDGWPALLPRELKVLPDPATAWIDPFLSPRTLSLIGSFQGSEGGGTGATHCPRSLSSRALAQLAGSGLADADLFGSEPEFFLFEGGSSASPTGGRPSRVLAGHGLSEAVQEEVLLTLRALGVPASRGHRPATDPCQCLSLAGRDLLRASDAVMVTRYVVRQVARRHGLTASFLPRPTAEPVCAGMAVHQSLWKGGHPLFFGQGTYGGLSQTARWYVGGLLQHGPSLAAFTNPGTNSYRRLRSGPEAPTRLTYARNDPSTVIGIPQVEGDPARRRLVLRQSDGLTNPYLAFSAMLLAGLDGVRRQIDPGPPDDRQPGGQEMATPRPGASLPGDLQGALEALSNDRDYLLAGGVFSPELLEDWIALKRREVEELEHHPHPHEFSFYPQA
jgi:glutamine synthetase